MNNISNLKISTELSNKLSMTTSEKFIPRLQGCVDVLKKLSTIYNNETTALKNVTELSQRPSLISPLPNECSNIILLLCPPSTARVCKAWHKFHEITWNQLQRDHPLDNLAALNKGRIRYQLCYPEMQDPDVQELLNLALIGHKLLRGGVYHKEGHRYPIEFVKFVYNFDMLPLEKRMNILKERENNFEQIPLKEKAKRVTDFFKENQEKIGMIGFDGIGLTTIPQIIFTLENLQVLDLTLNQIFAVKVKQPNKLKQLQEFYLQDNPLKEYPKEMMFHLCVNNSSSGKYYANNRDPKGRTNGGQNGYPVGHNDYPPIRYNWQYCLTERCEWKYSQYINKVSKIFVTFRELQQILRPYKGALERLNLNDAQQAAVIQDLLEMICWESMASVYKTTQPINNLYNKILPDVATCLKSLEFLGSLANLNKPLLPIWGHLHKTIEKFINTFILLQDKFVDVNAMKAMIQHYETIVSILNDKACFEVDFPEKSQVLSIRDKWMKEQEIYLKDLKQVTEELSKIDLTTLNLVKLFLDRTDDEFLLINKKLKDMVMYFTRFVINLNLRADFEKGVRHDNLTFQMSNCHA